MFRSTPADRQRLLDAYRALAPFPDAADALAALAPRPRWILSNGTRAMLEPLVASSSLAPHIDGILSVDAAGIYKPSPRVYQLAVDRLQLAPARDRVRLVERLGCSGRQGVRLHDVLDQPRRRAGRAPRARPDFIVGSLAHIAATQRQ